MIARVLLSPAVRSLVMRGATATVIASSLLVEVEGVSLTAYQDTAKVWTICHGYTKGVQPGDTATPGQCARLLRDETAGYLSAVDRLVTAPMTPGQHAAFGSFAYNVGVANFKRSTLLRRFNAGDPNACEEFARWVYVKGKDCRNPANNCRGIVIRRQQERALCEMAVTNVASN